MSITDDKLDLKRMMIYCHTGKQLKDVVMSMDAGGNEAIVVTFDINLDVDMYSSHSMNRFSFMEEVSDEVYMLHNYENLRLVRKVLHEEFEPSESAEVFHAILDTPEVTHVLERMDKRWRAGLLDLTKKATLETKFLTGRLGTRLRFSKIRLVYTVALGAEDVGESMPE
jgi:hypothetical protein